MEEREIRTVMFERMTEMVGLRAKFQGREEKPQQKWMADCISVIAVWLHKADEAAIADTLITLALAMWQAGYEAAPKLEFVLPEGAGG